METVQYLIQLAPIIIPIDHLALYLALLILWVYYIWPLQYCKTADSFMTVEVRLFYSVGLCVCVCVCVCESE